MIALPDSKLSFDRWMRIGATYFLGAGFFAVVLGQILMFGKMHLDMRPQIMSGGLGLIFGCQIGVWLLPSRLSNVLVPIVAPRLVFIFYIFCFLTVYTWFLFLDWAAFIIEFIGLCVIFVPLRRLMLLGKRFYGDNV